MSARLALAGAAVLLAACSQTPAPPPHSGSCADAVRQFQASPALGIQGGTPRQTATRGTAQVYAQQALVAANAKDEAGCWRNLDIARTSLSD